MLAPRFPPSHILGILLLAGLAFAAPFLNLLTLAIATTATIIAVAAMGSILHHRQAPEA
jgi:low temperature requirement protein LtrA